MAIRLRRMFRAIIAPKKLAIVFLALVVDLVKHRTYEWMNRELDQWSTPLLDSVRRLADEVPIFTTWWLVPLVIVGILLHAYLTTRTQGTPAADTRPQSVRSTEAPARGTAQPSLRQARIFRPPDVFWNPRAQHEATKMDHALSLREIAVRVEPEVDVANAIRVTLSYRLMSRGWRAVGYDMAPWIHLEFLDQHGQALRIEGSQNWDVVEFEFDEDRRVRSYRRLLADIADEIDGVRVRLGAGYARQAVSVPPGPEERLSMLVVGPRAFVRRVARRLRRDVSLGPAYEAPTYAQDLTAVTAKRAGKR